MSTTRFDNEPELASYPQVAAQAAPVQASVVPLGGPIKRLFDIVFAATALILLAAMMAAIALALKIFEGGPVLFSHERVGVGGKRFACWKFRTMVEDAEARLARILETDPDAAAEFESTRKLKNDPRIIPVIGPFLRRSSLDELPQFFNVLLGQMSVVGPRPVTESEWLENFGRQHAYISARPGITGVWQTSGRNNVSFGERVRMDAEYIQNWSFWRDIQIIFRTVGTVCVQRNGY